MDKLRIGIIVDEHYLPSSGGGFSYYRTLLRGLNAYNWNDQIEIVNLVFDAESLQHATLTQPRLLVNKNYIYSAAYLYYKFLHGIAYTLGRQKFKKTWRLAALRIARLRNRNTETILAANKIDLVYYLKPEENYLNYPLIATHWDVGHRSMHAFPEVALNGNYEIREQYYTSALNKAFLIICESETGAEELLRFYAMHAGKIKIMPIFSGDVVRQQVPETEQARILQKYHLHSRRFFLYPAQFWAHKNHYNLLQAFARLETDLPEQPLRLMLCGGDKGNMSYIREQIRALGLEDRVLLPGYVPDEELSVFYKHALALVMPTFLGPTNIPLLEAAELGCPVLCSNLEGHREILQEAALYFDPADAAGMCTCMQRVSNDEAFRQQLTAAGYRRVAASSFSIGKSLQLLEQTLLEAMPVRKTWGFNSRLLVYLAACSILAA